MNQEKSEPSKQLVDMTAAAFRHHHNHLDVLKSKTAELAKDTDEQLGQSGSRSVSASRELLYRGEQMDVVLSINADDAGYLNTIRGQIFLAQPTEVAKKRSPEGIVLSVQQLRGNTYLAMADSIGRFRLSNLDNGTYKIDILSRNEKLLIEKLTI